MKVDGLRHVTAITVGIEANLNFHGRLLGLRLVWPGVNADDPEMRHVAYGDERGRPSSIVTFFDLPGVAPGRPGSEMAHPRLKADGTRHAHGVQVGAGMSNQAWLAR